MNIIEYSIAYLLLPVAIFVAIYCFQSKFSFKPAKKIAAWLVSRDLFYRPETERGDELFINAIRIILGCFLLYRLFSIAEFTLPLDPDSKTIIALCLYCLLISTFTLGFFAPLSALLLLLYQLHFNFTLRTYTLGVDVTAMMLICMVLYPVGRRLSVDALLAKKSKAIQGLYRWFSYHDMRTQVVTAKAVAFYSYCLLCLYSVLLHFNDPLWLNGEAAIHLLGSSYLSKYYQAFQHLFSNYSVAVWLAQFSMIGMFIWYLILGPAVLFGGILRKAVLFWSIAFFILSTFILQLSILGYLEFLLLAIWFWTNALPKELKSVNMLYDDRCNLCDRTVRFLRAIDLTNVLVFRPISQNEDKAKWVGVAPQDLRNDLYSWEDTSGTVYSGYAFYLHISRRLVLLHALFPILWLFKWLTIGPWIYRYIAKRRIKLFGVCNLPMPSASDQLDTKLGLLGSKQAESKNFYKPFLLTLLIFSIVFITIMPVNPWAKIIESRFAKIVRSAHILSWSRIDVFNVQDLKMTQHYFTAEIVTEGSRQLLPFTGIDGSRLEWHRSDRVYFGNSLRWRRLKNFQPILPPTKRDISLYCEIMKWAKDKHFNYNLGISFDFYEAPWPLISESKAKYIPAQKVGELLIKPQQCGL